MYRLLCCLVFLFCTITVLAQEPAVPPPRDSQPIPRDDQPVPHAERPDQERSMPPDTAAPADELSTEQVSAAIDDKLAGEPALKGSSVKATVTDRQVVLTGTVENDRQHEVALRIAGSYASGREIVDNIETRGKT